MWLFSPRSVCILHVVYTSVCSHRAQGDADCWFLIIGFVFWYVHQHEHKIKKRKKKKNAPLYWIEELVIIFYYILNSITFGRNFYLGERERVTTIGRWQSSFCCTRLKKKPNCNDNRINTQDDEINGQKKMKDIEISPNHLVCSPFLTCFGDLVAVACANFRFTVYNKKTVPNVHKIEE